MVLLYKNNTLAKVENWSTYPSARKMIFAFNGTTIFNSNCNSESVIIAEFRKAIIHSINQAIKEGKLDKVKLFLDKDASSSDDYVRNKEKWSNTWTLLHYAVYNGHLDVVKGAFELLLEKSGDINAKDGRGWTPLHYATYYGQLNIVNFLIEKGADTNARGSHDKTPLHLASQEGYLGVATSLINKGAEINSQDKEGWTPLIYAIFRRHVNMFQLLLDRDANIKLRSNEGWTPLHWAINIGSLYMMRSLIEKGAGIEDVDDLGWRPLHYAVKEGYFNMVKILVEKGADINAETSDGVTPLDVASVPEIADFLREKQGEKERPVQRKRRHHHGDHPRHYDRLSHRLLAADLSNQPEVVINDARQDASKDLLQNDEIDYTKGGATSGASKPSSWIDAVKGVFQFISSPFKPAIDMKHSQTSKARITQSIDTNGTLLLLDVFIRKITGQKYISTVDQSMQLEAQGYALNIMKEFERVLKDTAKRSGVSVNESSFNYFKTYQAIEGKMKNSELSKIPTILYSAIEEAYPENKKFLSILKGNIEKMLDGQQIVNNRNSSNQTQSITNQLQPAKAGGLKKRF